MDSWPGSLGFLLRELSESPFTCFFEWLIGGVCGVGDCVYRSIWICIVGRMMLGHGMDLDLGSMRRIRRAVRTIVFFLFIVVERANRLYIRGHHPTVAYDSRKRRDGRAGESSCCRRACIFISSGLGWY